MSLDSTFQFYTPTSFTQQLDTIIDEKEWTESVVNTSIEFNKSQAYQKGVPNQAESKSWILSILLFGFIAISFSRSFYKKRFKMLFASFLNWKLSKQIIRYEIVYFHPVNILLTLNFILAVPLFFSYFLHAKANESLLYYFQMALIPLILYLIFKFVAYRFSSWLLGEKEAIEEYVFQTNLFNKYLGVTYLILTTFLFYSSVKIEILYFLAITFFILFLLFQLVRGVIIGIERNNNLFFIILYLCTLEILPWLAMGKWINNYL